MSSRSRAARSKSRSSAAEFICFSRSRTSRSVLPARKSQKSSTILRWAAASTFPTHGAEHLSMYPSRHGRSIWLCRLKTPPEHVRAGNTRVSRSNVSRIAQACA